MCSAFSKELSYYWGLTAAPPWFHWVSSVEYYQIATHGTLNAAPLPAICSLLESSITCQVATHGSCLVHFLEAVLSFQVVERFIIYHIVALPHTAHPCFVCVHCKYCKYLSITSIASIWVLRVSYCCTRGAPCSSSSSTGASWLQFPMSAPLFVFWFFDLCPIFVFYKCRPLRSPTSGWRPFGPLYFILSSVTFTRNPPPLGKVFRR